MLLILAQDQRDAIHRGLAPTPTLLATASPQTAFRGIALAPVAATAVGFGGAGARARQHRVVLRWSDGRGDDVIGFSVLRARLGAKHRVPISRKLITAGLISGPQHFRFVDRHGLSGDRYFIVARRTDGKTVTHGPVVARSTHKGEVHASPGR